MMTFAEFHNSLRLIHSIDAHEIGNPEWWPSFRDDPVGFLLCSDDERAAVIWRAMVMRCASLLPEIRR